MSDEQIGSAVRAILDARPVFAVGDRVRVRAKRFDGRQGRG